MSDKKRAAKAIAKAARSNFKKEESAVTKKVKKKFPKLTLEALGAATAIATKKPIKAKLKVGKNLRIEAEKRKNDKRISIHFKKEF